MALDLINKGEIPMKLFSFFVVGFSGFYFAIKKAYMRFLAINLNLALPFFSGFIPVHSLELRRAIFHRPSIDDVLVSGSFSEIASSVVKGIMVNVVNVFSAHNKVMEFNSNSVNPANNVKGISTFIDAPVEFAYRFKVFIVNKCNVFPVVFRRGFNSV